MVFTGVPIITVAVTTGFGAMPVEVVAVTTGFGAVPVEMVAVTMAIAEDFLHFLAEGRFDDFGFAFAARHATNVRRVYIQFAGYTLVEPAKKSERLKWTRAIIKFVTIHDFLLRRLDLNSGTATT